MVSILTQSTTPAMIRSSGKMRVVVLARIPHCVRDDTFKNRDTRGANRTAKSSSARKSEEPGAAVPRPYKDKWMEGPGRHQRHRGHEPV